MSEVFEGILVSTVRDVARTWARDEELQLAFDVLTGMSVIYRVDSRDGFSFSKRSEELAARISTKASRALLVRYDSRAGFRASVAFRDGSELMRYGPDDELYVPLDNDGEPRSDVPPATLSDLDPEEEYETAVNAIELGLREIDGPPWSVLRSFIASH
ncbi:MAG TPA: hypothetical protein VNM92_13970 [Thermoanaerobaculia bacterium]|nr:hypothetical protein [Thermoanaerobaculia bacterium]